jgi:tetratricopeptide (TPR) repeat protein
MGNALKDLGEYAEAIENYKQAVLLKPDYAEAYNNLGVALKDYGRCTEAIENYERAIQLNPDYTEAHWNRSLALLLSGRLAEGWKEYQRQYNRLNTISYPYHYEQPYWDGASFAGKKLLVIYQQGLGDNIQFVRYLPMVKARGGTVIYETKKSLVGLFEGFEGIDELVEAAPDCKPAVSFDFYVSLLDLPRIFGTTLKTIPSQVPYLYPDSAKAESWRDRIVRDNLTVGIAWAGGPAHRNDHNRSLALEVFAPLAKIDGMRLYGLQKGRGAEEAAHLPEDMAVTNLGEQFEDFADTAAVIENLDLVISVDTAVLHLAGAMGKPVWALLPFAPDWRWMLKHPDSPWYPAMRLFRQKKPGDWHELIDRVRNQLQILVDK